MTNVQRLTVLISSPLLTWNQLPGPGSELNSSWKVSKPALTSSLSWWKPMFLTEKTEENRQLERIYGNISLVKVVQNDWI